MAKLFSEQFAFGEGDSVVVVGLGRFGGAAAQSLMSMGHDVMGIDRDEQLVQSWADRLTHTVQADATNVLVLRQLGVADFRHAIVGIGDNLATSLLTLMALTELGVADIWVKALSKEHSKIAERIGAHHVVFPEADMGERVAHLISGRMMDYIEFDDGFAVAKIKAPPFTHGRTLSESQVRQNFGVTVVGIKRASEAFQHAVASTTILQGDLLVVSGPTQLVEKFAARIRA